MKEIKYQQKYVRQLVDMTIDLLRLNGHRKTLIFKAPTGSGKTVMASQMLADLTEELQSRGDSPYQPMMPIRRYCLSARRNPSKKKRNR